MALASDLPMYLGPSLSAYSSFQELWMWERGRLFLPGTYAPVTTLSPLYLCVITTCAGPVTGQLNLPGDSQGDRVAKNRSLGLPQSKLGETTSEN